MHILIVRAPHKAEGRDRGAQHLSIRYGGRLVEAGIEPSVGSVGERNDNALSETINGLYKTERVHKPGRFTQQTQNAVSG